MTASLYQSGSFTAGSGVAFGLFSRRTATASQEVVEVPFRPHPASHVENVRRDDGGVERDEAPCAVPQIARVAQQIVDLEGMLRVEPDVSVRVEIIAEKED